MDDRNVGLQACWYGNYYGSPSYNKSIKASDKDLNIGMHLWYGSTSAQLEEAVWVYGADEWSLEKPLYGYNGHAGIACFSWGDDSITYVMLVNLQAQLEIWWKDLNTTKKSSPRHPINTWQNSTFFPILISSLLTPEPRLHIYPSSPAQHISWLHKLPFHAAQRQHHKWLQYQLGCRELHDCQERYLLNHGCRGQQA